MKFDDYNYEISKLGLNWRFSEVEEEIAELRSCARHDSQINDREYFMICEALQDLHIKNLERLYNMDWKKGNI